MKTMRSLLCCGLLAAGCGLNLGCMTYTDDSRDVVHEREDMLLLQESVQRLSGRMETVEMEISRLRSDMASLTAAQSRGTQTQALQSQVDELNRRLQSLDAARAADKQEVVDRLSRQVADVLKKSAPAPAKASATPQKTRKTGTDYGYEHEVKPGETLSAIAVAYGVKSSDILEANNIKDANTLRVGQKLFIPEK